MFRRRADRSDARERARLSRELAAALTAADFHLSRFRMDDASRVDHAAQRLEDAAGEARKAGAVANDLQREAQKVMQRTRAAMKRVEHLADALLKAEEAVRAAAERIGGAGEDVGRHLNEISSATTSVADADADRELLGDRICSALDTSGAAIRTALDEWGTQGAQIGPWDDPAVFGRDIIGRVASGMFADAEARRIDSETLSTALVAAVVEIIPPDRPRRIVVLRVGDSTAYVLRNGFFHDCFEHFRKDDEIQGGATNAVPGYVGAVETGTVLLGNGEVLVLCTDGLSNPMHNDEVRAQLAAWWGGDPVPGILEFGWQLEFGAKSYGDDRSAICVWGR